MAYYGDDNPNNIYNDANSTYYGGDGNDALGKSTAAFTGYGGHGHDIIYQNGNFYLNAFGGFGNDLIAVSNASSPSAGSVLYGDYGTDIIRGSGMHDAIYGGDDQDSLHGFAAND